MANFKRNTLILMIALSVAVLIGVTTSLPDIRSPSSGKLLSKEEYAEVLVQAQRDDLDSVLVLIRHLEADGAQAEANRWRKKALELGDIFELRNDSQTLFHQSRESSLSAPEAKNLLVKALKSVERIPEGERSASDIEMISKIKAELAFPEARDR